MEFTNTHGYWNGNRSGGSRLQHPQVHSRTGCGVGEALASTSTQRPRLEGGQTVLGKGLAPTDLWEL